MRSRSKRRSARRAVNRSWRGSGRSTAPAAIAPVDAIRTQVNSVVLIVMTGPQCHRSDIVPALQQYRCAVPRQGCETLNECTISVRGSCLIRTASISVGRGGAYAPPLPNCQTEIPSLRALSARLSWMPVPGKTMTPIGITVSMRSLRLNGAALACFVQSGLKAT